MYVCMHVCMYVDMHRCAYVCFGDPVLCPSNRQRFVSITLNISRLYKVAISVGYLLLDVSTECASDVQHYKVCDNMKVVRI